METLSKVNEQKDNVLAPNTTLSLSETLARGIMEGVRYQDSEVYEFVCTCGGEHTPLHMCFCVCYCWQHVKKMLHFNSEHLLFARFCKKKKKKKK